MLPELSILIFASNSSIFKTSIPYLNEKDPDDNFSTRPRNKAELLFRREAKVTLPEMLNLINSQFLGLLFRLESMPG